MISFKPLEFLKQSGNERVSISMYKDDKGEFGMNFRLWVRVRGDWIPTKHGFVVKGTDLKPFHAKLAESLGVKAAPEPKPVKTAKPTKAAPVTPTVKIVDECPF